jgi:hypothetical protein
MEKKDIIEAIASLSNIYNASEQVKELMEEVQKRKEEIKNIE